MADLMVVMLDALMDVRKDELTVAHLAVMLV